MKYTVVTEVVQEGFFKATNQATFAAKVEDAMKTGWTPQGGMQAVAVQGRLYFFQAMTKAG